ncbi:MAG: sulfatase-like hydrolase/transferase [Bacteroidota bacterium]
MVIFQLLCLLLFFLLLSAITSKALRLFVSLVGTTVMIMQLASVFLGGGLIDDRFWFHFNMRDVMLGSAFFGAEKWLFLLLPIVIFSLLWFGARWVEKPSFFKKKYAFTGMMILFGCFLLPGGVLYPGTSSVSLGSEEGMSFGKALTAVGIPESKYVYPNQVKASKGKNIIVIYVESLELGYLKNTDLTPNLNRLSKNMNLIPLNMGPGSDWSAGSFYTGISGLPAFFSFGAGGNAIFQNTREINLTGIGHILEAAGYQRTFMLGNKQFAGMDDMLSAFRFSVKSEEDMDTAYTKVAWGLNDIDLFAEAKKTIKANSASNQPFAFYMATIGSHGPSGFFDPRVTSLNIPAKGSQLEKMVAATDALIGNFVNFLTEEGLMEHTALYIMPDHLLMGNPPILSQFEEDRSMYLLTNADTHSQSTLEQIELPGIILKGAEVKHNAVFLSDFISGKAAKVYLLDHKKEIQQLNEASVKGENLAGGFTVTRNGSQIEIKSSFFIENGNLPLNENEVFCLVMDHKFRPQKQHISSLYEAFYMEDKSFFPRLIVGLKNEQLYCAIRYGPKRIVTKKGSEQVIFTRSDIEVLREWPFSAEFYNLPQHAEYHSPERRLYVTSSAAGGSQVKTPSAIRFDDRSISVNKPGIWVVGKDESVKVFDPAVEADINALKTIAVRPGNIKCIIVHQNGDGPFNQHLSEAGLVKLSGIGNNMAYIAHFENGIFSEHLSDNTISFTFDLEDQMTNSTQQIQQWGKDATRFIAHAGGTIDGIRYTNTLEALNRAYRNGFRWFELDILITDDGQFVAAHDWIKWHQMTGSDGRAAVTYQTFMSKKILDKYTPLDIQRINDWFRKHNDAILVTDKINDPMAFAQVFEFPERLVMEVFSREAVNAAKQVKGLRVMLSQNVLQSIPGDKVQFFKRNGIDMVATSWKLLRDNPQLCQQLADNGIKIYVFHLNGKERRNEAEVLLHDLPIAYGMYADDWGFDWGL